MRQRILAGILHRVLHLVRRVPVITGSTPAILITVRVAVPTVSL
jgi:hypothetical protein